MRSAATVGGVRGGVRQDEALGRAGRQVDADLAHDLDLGGGDPGAPGPTTRSTGSRPSSGEAVRQRADRLDAAGDEERVHAQEAGGAEQHRVDVAVAVRRARRRRPARRRRRAPGRRVMTSEDGYGAEPPGT